MSSERKGYLECHECGEYERPNKKKYKMIKASGKNFICSKCEQISKRK